MMGIDLARKALAKQRRKRSFALCYHGVGETSIRIDPRFLRVSPKRLRAQIEVLRDAGYEFVTLSELVASGPGNGSPPRAGLVALTFDDGYADNHDTLLPMLREYAIPATIYITTGLMGRPNPWLAPDSGMRMMTPEEVVACSKAGLEIGAHTLTHPDLSLVGAEGCRREVTGSRDVLRELTDTPVHSFAYPYFHVGPEAVHAVRDAGYASAVTGVGYGDYSPLTYERTAISGKDGLASFTLKLLGRYDPLLDSAPLRVARAATRSLRRRSWELLDHRG
jgi:peptidoglycan/xylan/chitin deacetylase (PgdA/CDA1 family)